MSSSSSLQFRDLDRSTSEFPLKLTNLLLRKDSTAQVRLQSETDPGGLVEDLDLVCMQITFTHSLLNGVIGSQCP